MKISNVKNVQGFFNALDKCVGKVELVTEDGDRLNLKSKLTQFVALSGVFTSPELGELELICYEPEDTHRIVEFLMRG